MKQFENTDDTMNVILQKTIRMIYASDAYKRYAKNKYFSTNRVFNLELNTLEKRGIAIQNGIIRRYGRLKERRRLAKIN